MPQASLKFLGSSIWRAAYEKPGGSQALAALSPAFNRFPSGVNSHRDVVSSIDLFSLVGSPYFPVSDSMTSAYVKCSLTQTKRPIAVI